MGKIDYEHGGRISGLVGNVVFAGETVRSRPTRTTNGWTEAQKSQRLRYKAVVGLYRKLKNVIITPVWSYAPKKRLTAYNLFISNNMQAFDHAGKIKDPTKIKVAIGELPQPFNISASLNPVDPNKVNIRWENEEVIDPYRVNDHLVVMFYNGKNFSMPISTEYLRKEEAASVEFPEAFGSGSYVYVFFGNRDKNSYCESWVGLV